MESSLKIFFLLPGKKFRNDFRSKLTAIITEKKKSAIKSPNISNFFRQRSGYISDFALISLENNLADFTGLNSTNPYLLKKN